MNSDLNHTQEAEGRSLRELVASGGPIPADQLFSGIPALLEQLQQTNTGSLGITPDTLFRMPDGALILCGSAPLTDGFAPVEQYTANAPTPCADVYGLCATVYFALTGIVPPHAVERLDQDTLAAPSALGISLRPQWEQALLQGLAVQPRNRLQTLAELRAQLLPAEAYPVTGPISADTVPAKKKGLSLSMKLLIGGIALILVLVAVLVILLLNRNKPAGEAPVLPDAPAMETPVDTPPAEPTPEPTPEPEPEPEPVPPQNVFELAMGLTVEIRDQEVAIIGYDDSAEDLELPDTYRELPITTIDDGAFRNCTTLSTVLLGQHIDTIEVGAFENCSNLLALGYEHPDHTITCYDSFRGCDQFLFILADATLVWSGRLPDQVTLCPIGLETPRGVISEYNIDSQGFLYGILDEDPLTGSSGVVVFRVFEETNALDLNLPVEDLPVLYLFDTCLDGADSLTRLDLGSETTFPYSMIPDLLEIESNYNTGSLSHAWILSCLAADLYNQILDSDVVMQPDHQLLNACMIRSQELTACYDADLRPDGSDYDSVLDELGIEAHWIWRLIYQNEDPDTIYTEAAETIESDPMDGDGEPFEKIAVGLVEHDGIYYSAWFLTN